MEKSSLMDYLNWEREDWAKYVGIEQLDEDDSREDDLPYGAQSIRIEQKMITVYQIEHWIKAGMLNLNPEYQRNLVWDQRRKSALIESLMLKIPIPSFYLDEGKDGVKSVIDGMQRLSAIHEFLNEGFTLKGLEYITEGEGKTFSQLSGKFRSYIEDTILQINILDERCPEMVKFDIFRRVNTGGVPLNHQEIRNIMAAPKVRELLRDMAECPEFFDATRGRVNDVRMGAQELCLRYLAVLFVYVWHEDSFANYRGLKKEMDRAVLFLNGKLDEDAQAYSFILDAFKRAMCQCHRILGEASFCKPGSSLINKSLFTAWAVVLSNVRPSDEQIESSAEQIFARYQSHLVEDPAFYEAITFSTGSKKHIGLSIKVIRSILEECLC